MNKKRKRDLSARIREVVESNPMLRGIHKAIASQPCGILPDVLAEWSTLEIFVEKTSTSWNPNWNLYFKDDSWTKFKIQNLLEVLLCLLWLTRAPHKLELSIHGKDISVPYDIQPCLHSMDSGLDIRYWIMRGDQVMSSHRKSFIDLESIFADWRRDQRFYIFCEGAPTIEVVSKLSFHNLRQVWRMYKKTLDVLLCLPAALVDLCIFYAINLDQ